MRFKLELKTSTFGNIEEATIVFNASSWQTAPKWAENYAKSLGMTGPGCTSTVTCAEEPSIAKILEGKDAIRPLTPGDIAAWTAEDIVELEGTMADRELEKGVISRRFQTGMQYEQGKITREKAMADLIGSGLLPAKAVRRLDAIDSKTVGEVRE
jgi:hypothetical protein